MKKCALTMRQTDGVGLLRHAHAGSMQCASSQASGHWGVAKVAMGVLTGPPTRSASDS